MAISALFYKNNKKLNSTKLPVQSTGDFGVSIELKDATNLFTPTIVLSTNLFMNGSTIKNPMEYNYCYIQDFNRYYFVRSWSWILGRWECSLEVDVLASFKTQIGDSTQYVLRAYSAVDPDIIDTKYPIKAASADSNYQEKSYGPTYSIWNTNLTGATITQGYYRISIVNNDSGSIGAVSHYAMAPAVAAELMNKLYSAPTWLNIQDANISEDLQKMMFNPMQYITSILWIPTGFDTTGATGIHTIPYGWWSLTLSGSVYQIPSSKIAKSLTFSIPVVHHPQYTANRHWVQLSPYTTAALYVTPFGFIPLDTSKIYDATHIDLEIRLDVITGKGTLLVSSHKTVGSTTTYGGLIYTTVAQVGIPISIAQMSVDMSALGQASTWVGAAGVALATGGLQDSLKDLKNGLIDGAREIFAGAKETLTGARWNPQAAGGGRAGEMYNALQAGLYRGIDSTDVGSAVKAGLQRGVDSSRGSSLLSSLKEIAGDIGSAALAAAGTCQSMGSTGGFAALTELIFIQWYFQRIVDADPTHYGYPLCQRKKLNTLSGFILCANGDDFSANCTPAERQAITAFMEAGFYYE